MFDTAIEAFHRAGNDGSLALTLAYLTVFLDDIDQPSIAATVHGASTRYAAINTVTKLPSTVEHVRARTWRDGLHPMCRRRCRHGTCRSRRLRPPPDRNSLRPARAGAALSEPNRS